MGGYVFNVVAINSFGFICLEKKEQRELEYSTQSAKAKYLIEFQENNSEMRTIFKWTARLSLKRLHSLVILFSFQSIFKTLCMHLRKLFCI